MKSTGKPSLLQNLLRKAILEYKTKKRNYEKLRRQLFLTAKHTLSVEENLYRYENNTPVANNTPALEKDIKRNNLYSLFSPKNNTTMVVNFDPRNTHDNNLKKLLAKALPPARRINPQYQKLFNETKKARTELSLSPRPTLALIARRTRNR